MCFCEIALTLVSNDFLHSSLIEFFFNRSLLPYDTNLMLSSKIKGKRNAV